MLSRLLKFSLSLVIGTTIGSGLFLVPPAQAAALDGRILLQVQDKGQAWYVNPLDSRRYYLGRPDDAFAVMRHFGLGITNADFNSFFNSRAPLRLAGRILLKVQDQGKAYYVHPLDQKLYYLGRPADAFGLMRRFGLGITNADLVKISLGTIAPDNSLPASGVLFNFKYQNTSYSLTLNLSTSLYQAYQAAPHVYSYIVGQEPPDARDAFYGLFLKIKTGDISLDEIISQARLRATEQNWSEDQLAEFVLALVQYIPYDQGKLQADNLQPFYPYETLYLKRGICSDKTFLAVALLRRLGYGAAILDFPDINLTAAGVACPREHSLNDSGYCFIETTNYFPWSVIPQNINGQAQTASEQFDNLFNPAGLGKIEIKQATLGKTYQGAALIRSKAEELRTRQAAISVQQVAIQESGAALSAQEQALNNLKSQLDTYYNNGQIAQYNALIPEYNTQVNQYNAALAAYQAEIAEYNTAVSELDQRQKEFYQFD